MRRVILASVAALGLCLSATGCSFVTSAMGENSAQSNGAWWVEGTGLNRFLLFSSKVYYCPPASGGAATCMEAEMIESASAGAGGGGDATGGDMGGGDMSGGDMSGGDSAGGDMNGSQESGGSDGM